MYPVVMVRWADAHTSEGGWLSLDDYKDDGETIVETVDFLIPVGDAGSKENHVSLWQTICEGEAIHAMHIPVGMVREMIALSKNGLDK